MLLKSIGYHNTRTGTEEVKENPMATMRVQKQQRRERERKVARAVFFFATVSMQEKKCDIEQNNSFSVFFFLPTEEGESESEPNHLHDKPDAGANRRI
jgi:hypothetical protein